MLINNVMNFDANELAFFARELESISTKTYDAKFARLKAREMIPVAYDAKPGDTVYTYRTYTPIGFAKIIANYANDLPRVTVKGTETHANIRDLATSYGWTIQEVRASARTPGKNLDTRLASAARRAIAQAENRIAFLGDEDNNMLGLLNNPNVPTGAVTADGVGGSTTWAQKTPEQIIRDVTVLINDIVDVTNEVEEPDTVLFPVAQFSILSTVARGPYQTGTILSFLKEAFPFIKFWGRLTELKTAGTGGTAMMIAYKRDEEHLALQISSEFEQLPVQVKGLEFNVPCLESLAGTVIYYPLSVNTAYGI